MKRYHSRPQRNDGKALRGLRAAMATMEQWPERLPGFEMDRLTKEINCSPSTIQQARRLLRLNPGLAPRVLSQEITLYIALEMAERGERDECPTCLGAGYILKPLRKS